MGFFDSLIKSAGRTIGREAGKKAVNAVVDMLDGDDDKKKKTSSRKSASKKEEKEAVKKEEKKENPNISASSPMAKAMSQGKSEYDTTPDVPVPFVGFNGWLCIKDAAPQEVIKVLGLRNSQVANWESGIKAAESGFMEKVFVSPLINGCVLVIGYIPFGVKDSVDEELKILGKFADNFSEMTCYATQSTVDIHVWAKFVNGKLKRGYGWVGERGEIYLKEGNMTPEEHKLGFAKLITDPDCDWETVTLPDMEHVFAIAKEWSISPDFSDVNVPPSTGFVCEI